MKYQSVGRQFASGCSPPGLYYAYSEIDHPSLFSKRWRSQRDPEEQKRRKTRINTSTWPGGAGLQTVHLRLSACGSVCVPRFLSAQSLTSAYHDETRRCASFLRKAGNNFPPFIAIFMILSYY
jgi:hypothetical protein